MTVKPELNGKSFWKRQVVILPLAAMLFVGLRGYVSAKIIGGEYLLSSFVFDLASVLAVLVVFQSIDLLVTNGLKQLIGDQTQTQKLAYKAIRLVFVVFVFGTFVLVAAQMHPAKIACRKTPVDSGMKFSEHTLQTADGFKISAWLIPASNSNRPVVVMTHGLGSNKQSFLFMSEFFRQHLDYNVVTFDMRGHGNSDGHTCSIGVREAEDVKAAFDFAKAQFPNQPVYSWSTSLGGAATLRAAAEYQIFDKLVVESTFSSVKSLAMETKFCFLGPLDNFGWNLARLWYWLFVGEDIEKFGPAIDIAKIDARVLLIHGTADPIIPYSESQITQKAAPPSTELWIVEGTQHSNSINDYDYGPRVQQFFEGR